MWQLGKSTKSQSETSNTLTVRALKWAYGKPILSMQTLNIFILFLFCCVFFFSLNDIRIFGRGIQLCEDQIIRLPWNAANQNGKKR